MSERVFGLYSDPKSLKSFGRLSHQLAHNLDELVLPDRGWRVSEGIRGGWRTSEATCLTEYEEIHLDIRFTYFQHF